MTELKPIHEELTQKYRQELISKLPPHLILSSQFLSQYPLGSNVSKVPETCGMLSTEQIKITNMTCIELLEKMSKGLLKAEEVMLAFGYRAAIAQQLVCCLTDFFLDEALIRARELDDYFVKTGKLSGPLHGIPVSVKDMLNLSGHLTSLSFLSLHQSAKPQTEDAHLVQILKEAGAIFYCKTTLPQSIMTLECDSFWGVTLNPFNTSLTSGGSSGGEGALLGMKGSVLGIGTDIGGSVRVPASLNGLYGLKPTALRVPNRGVGNYSAGRETVLGCIGPFTHSLEDLKMVMKVILGGDGVGASPWKKEVGLIDLPWKDLSGKFEKKKLRIGVMRNDGVVQPLLPISRALEELVIKLKEKGGDLIELIEVKMESSKTKQGWELIRRLYFPDGGKRIEDLLDGEGGLVGEPMKELNCWGMNVGGRLEAIKDVHEYWKLSVDRDIYRSEYSNYWNSLNIDVLLAPDGPGPAPLHGQSKYWTYTTAFNLVDYPAIAFPTTTQVDMILDKQNAVYQPLSEDDRILHDGYTPEHYKYAPLGLQLIAKRFKDEELLEALKLIDRIIES